MRDLHRRPQPSRFGPRLHPGRRVAFYSHDTFGLGHLRRSLLLAEAIVAAQPSTEVRIITGSPRANFFERSDSIEVARLPAVTKNDQGRYVSRNTDLPLAQTVRRRKDALRQSIFEFEPDVLVVDHAPAGLQGELLPLLADLRQRSSTRLVLGLRDILDDPESVRRNWARYGISSVIEELYHEVFVYGARELFDLGELYGLSDATRGRLRYLGYLGRAAADAPNRELDEIPLTATPNRASRRVLCLVGGGGDGFPLAEMFLRAGSEATYDATVVTGPFLPTGQRRRLQELATVSPRLHVLGFTSQLDPMIRQSDAVVTMGGYNSMMELVSLRRRALVVPRVFPRREQWLRANAFRELGLVDALDPRELTQQSLHAAIVRLLDAPLPPSPREVGVSFDGVANFVNAIQSLFSARGPERTTLARRPFLN